MSLEQQREQEVTVDGQVFIIEEGASAESEFVKVTNRDSAGVYNCRRKGRVVYVDPDQESALGGNISDALSEASFVSEVKVD